MKNKTTLYLTTQAMFIAILSIMAFIPSVGMITIGPVISFTLMHIPVLFAAYLFGWKSGLVHGFVFGMLSLLLAVTRPGSFMDPFFVNPLISVLPRMLFGFGSGLLFDFIRTIRKKFLSKLVLGGTSFVLTLLHGVLVLLALGIFKTDVILANLPQFGTFWAFFGFVILTNSLFEGLIAAAAVPVLAVSTQKLPAVRQLRDNYIGE